jgi:hypothetical protein
LVSVPRKSLNWPEHFQHPLKYLPKSAPVNVKMFLSKERKIDSDKLTILVEEAYDVVMRKIDSL